MEILKDQLIVTGRILTIFPLMLIIAHYMGKRSIGELPVFDFLIVISMGALVGADISDPDIKHFHTAGAIIIVGIMQRVVSILAIKIRKFGKLISFEPTVVIHNGSLLENNLRKMRYSIDNILQMLREKDVFDINDVELGILEANGKLTVYKKSAKSAVTIEDMGLSIKKKGLAYPVIIEGMVSEQVLSYMNKDVDWLDSQLRVKGLSKENVFFASLDENMEVHVSQSPTSRIPPVEH